MFERERKNVFRHTKIEMTAHMRTNTSGRTGKGCILTRKLNPQAMSGIQETIENTKNSKQITKF